MHGNVWEWCSDRYGDYPNGAVSDPVGPREGSLRVNRGGGFENDTAYCRAANRDLNSPYNRLTNSGFRVALSPSGIPKK